LLRQPFIRRGIQDDGTYRNPAVPVVPVLAMYSALQEALSRTRPTVNVSLAQAVGGSLCRTIKPGP